MYNYCNLISNKVKLRGSVVRPSRVSETYQGSMPLGATPVVVLGFME